MTVRVRILASLAGQPHQAGEEVDLPTDEARTLVDTGRAELIRGEPVETPEHRHVERTVKGRSRGRSNA